MTEGRIDWLFLETIADLKEKLKRGSEYDIIKAAGLLRGIFLDGHKSLYDKVRKNNCKIVFVTIDHTTNINNIFPDSTFQFINIDASGFPGAKTTQNSREQLLNICCLTFRGSNFTVADLIRAASNMKGGVHLGKAMNDKEANLLELDKCIQIMGEESTIVNLRGIIRVVITGLEPLITDIKQRNGL